MLFQLILLFSAFASKNWRVNYIQLVKCSIWRLVANCTFAYKIFRTETLLKCEHSHINLLNVENVQQMEKHQHKRNTEKETQIKNERKKNTWQFMVQWQGALVLFVPTCCELLLTFHNDKLCLFIVRFSSHTFQHTYRLNINWTQLLSASNESAWMGKTNIGQIPSPNHFYDLHLTVFAFYDVIWRTWACIHDWLMRLNKLHIFL